MQGMEENSCIIRPTRFYAKNRRLQLIEANVGWLNRARFVAPPRATVNWGGEEG